MALLGDEATVKRLYIREEKKIDLMPENPKDPPISIGPGEDLRILGKGVGVRHRRD